MQNLLALDDPQSVENLRAAVVEARRKPRGPLPNTLIVGWPFAAQVALDVPRFLDADEAREVIRELLERWQNGRRHETPPLLRLQRNGPLEFTELDSIVLRAVIALGQEAEWQMSFAIVTRDGWWDPRSGQSRVYRRLRWKGERVLRQPKRVHCQE